MHPRVPTRAVTSAAPASRHHATDNVSTGADVEPATTPRFTTQAPTLRDEKAQGTKLYAAFDDLQACVAAWTTRLARELSASEPSTAVAALPSPSDERQFVDRKRNSPSRRHTQTAGESVSLQPYSTPRYFAALDVTAQWATPSEHEVTGTPIATNLPTNVTSTASISTANTNKSAKTPTTSTLTLSPTWLVAEMEAFFQDKLALAIQARETQLVNTMHECVQLELHEKERRVERERNRAVALEAQQVAFDKERDHFQSRLDRRVAENNTLRKDFYKQLLMLRDLVAKNRNDARTLRALEEVMASVTTGRQERQEGVSCKPSTYTDQRKKLTKEGDVGVPSTASTDPPGSSTSVKREKDKWEMRAREAVAENQQLQEQILLLRQQLEEARGLDGELWFANAEHGLYERQRIIDCVYKAKCTWEQVGEAVVELLNNEMVWEAVEDSAYREKSRVSRGLEALLLRMEAVGGGRGGGNDSTEEGLNDGVDGDNEGDDGAKRTGARRRSAFSQASRMIACRTCNGCGYLDASAANGNQVEQEDDSYLRKTLAQVLELKNSLEEANNRTDEVEQQLLRTVMEGAHIKEKLERIEHTRAHSVNCCLQVDLDDEEEIDVDEILLAYTNSSDSPYAGGSTRRRGGRYKQYEHLIVELKNLLSERDAGLSQMRTAVSDAQTRLVTVQKTSQQEQERLQKELQALKGSLALAIKNRNEVIEEKQAAVSVLLKNMMRKKSQALSTKNFLLPRASVTEDDGASGVSASDADSDEDDEIEEEDDVIRSEIIARRYTQAISRVQIEHDEQQLRLKQAEDELGDECEKRKRTSSISLGSIVVTMASHPRDLFKALSTAHQELLTLRRSSHRSSVLQTDRLLTLTTHLAHISEELAMVKKRTIAEIDFWKLDCEKLQQANLALSIDLKKSQQLIEEANERVTEARAAGRTSSDKICALCEKHETRLLKISSKLLASSSVEENDTPSGLENSANPTAVARSSTLTEDERHELSAILLDLENLYSTLSSTKQQHAKTAITHALVGQSSTFNRPHSTAVAAGFWVELESGERSRRATTGASVLPSQVEGLILEGFRAAESCNAPRPSKGPLGSTTSPNDTGNEALLLQGSSISLNSSPLNRRKTIVRKVLTEQEIAKRQRARAYRAAPERRAPSLNDEPCLAIEESDIVTTEQDSSLEKNDVEFSSFINDEGNEVFYVDVEVEEDFLAAPEMEGVGSAEPVALSTFPQLVSDAGNPSPGRRSEFTIQIPSAEHPTGGLIGGMTPRIQLVAPADEIDKDPEVIEKLRDLVKYSTTSRELLALTNWRILVCHLQACRDKKRLDYVNDVWRDLVASGRDRGSATSLPLSVRTTMEKLVQYRELMLDAALRQRDELRKATRRTQAQLIHGVSTVLTTLSHKNKSQILVSDTLPFVHHDPETSPAHQHSQQNSPFRPLYPSARVNLSEIPGTQQIPTPSFPFSSHAPDLLNRHRVLIQEKFPPRSARPRSGQSLDPSEQAISSVFEHDNRFPQRSVKFSPAGDGEELSLTHSTSSLRMPTTSSSPAKSPSKAGLVIDVRRRPTHSAEPTRPTSNIADLVEPALRAHVLDPSVELSAREAMIPVLRIPTRPQSSPAGMNSRVRLRPSSAQVTRYGDDSTSEERQA